MELSDCDWMHSLKFVTSPLPTSGAILLSSACSWNSQQTSLAAELILDAVCSRDRPNSVSREMRAIIESWRHSKHQVF